MFSRILQSLRDTQQTPSLSIQSPREFIARTGRKITFLNPKSLRKVLFFVIRKRASVTFLKYFSAIILASKHVMPRRRPVLPAAICLSALNTLVARGSSRTHHGNWCLKAITFFFFIPFSSEPRVQRHVATLYRSEPSVVSSSAYRRR